MKSAVNWFVGVSGLCLIGMALAAVAWREAGWIGPCATALTGAVVLWYTFETQKLRKIADEQLKVSEKSIEATRKLAEDAIQPMLMISVGSAPRWKFQEKGDGLFVRNFGNGAAFDVQASELAWHNVRIRMTSTQILAKNRFAPARLEVIIDNKIIDSSVAQANRLTDILRPADVPECVAGKITYKSAAGMPYTTQYSVCKDQSGKIEFRLLDIKKD